MEKEIFYTIYQTTCMANGKFYIGKHKTHNLKDSYLGSSPELLKDIQKYGRSAFKKKILHVYQTEKKMIAQEKKIVNATMIKYQMCYNLRIGG